MKTIQFSTKSPNGHFLSYYLANRWSPNSEKIIALEVGFDYRLPKADDLAYVGYISPDGIFHRLCETTTWNWQVGACQTWIDDERVIFNTRNGETSNAVIFNINTKETEKKLPQAIWCVNSETQTAVSLNFGRIHRWRPAYGYAGLEDASEQTYLEADGIHIIHLATGKSDLVLTFGQIANLAYQDGMEEGHHWVDIASFNPSGTRVAFVHRWTSSSGRMNRLMTVGVDGSAPRALTPPGYSASHFCWAGDRIIVAWLEQVMASRAMAKLRGGYRRGYLRGILGTQFNEGFFTLLDSDTYSLSEKIARDVIRDDAHIMISPRQGWFVFDTYPDRNQKRHLIAYEQDSKQTDVIGTYWSPPELEGNIRCDLHASWSPDGKHICFQSAHEGTRQVYVVEAPIPYRK